MITNNLYTDTTDTTKNTNDLMIFTTDISTSYSCMIDDSFICLSLNFITALFCIIIYGRSVANFVYNYICCDQIVYMMLILNRLWVLADFYSQA